MTIVFSLLLHLCCIVCACFALLYGFALLHSVCNCFYILFFALGLRYALFYCTCITCLHFACSVSVHFPGARPVWRKSLHARVQPSSPLLPPATVVQHPRCAKLQPGENRTSRHLRVAMSLRTLLLMVTILYQLIWKLYEIDFKLYSFNWLLNCGFMFSTGSESHQSKVS